jgi:uracil-DNA glycosylase
MDSPGRQAEPPGDALIALESRCARVADAVCDGRTQVVFGVKPDADLMFVDEGPSRTNGRPFVGAAGKLLAELSVDRSDPRRRLYSKRGQVPSSRQS